MALYTTVQTLRSFDKKIAYRKLHCDTEHDRQIVQRLILQRDWWLKTLSPEELEQLSSVFQEAASSPPQRAIKAPRRKKVPQPPTRRSQRLTQQPQPSYMESPPLPRTSRQPHRAINSSSDEEDEDTNKAQWERHFKTFPATRSKADVASAAEFLADTLETGPSDIPWLQPQSLEDLLAQLVQHFSWGFTTADVFKAALMSLRGDFPKGLLALLSPLWKVMRQLNVACCIVEIPKTSDTPAPTQVEVFRKAPSSSRSTATAKGSGRSWDESRHKLDDYMTRQFKEQKLVDAPKPSWEDLKNSVWSS